MAIFICIVLILLGLTGYCIAVLSEKLLSQIILCAAASILVLTGALTSATIYNNSEKTCEVDSVEVFVSNYGNRIYKVIIKDGTKYNCVYLSEGKYLEAVDESNKSLILTRKELSDITHYGRNFID